MNTWIEGNLGASTQISVSGTKAEFNLPNQFDVIIMNPPYARATGRSDKFEEERGSLFGLIPETETREIIRKSYNDVREMVRKDLLNIAVTNDKNNNTSSLPMFAKK